MVLLDSSDPKNGSAQLLCYLSGKLKADQPCSHQQMAMQSLPLLQLLKCVSKACEILKSYYYHYYSLKMTEVMVNDNR